MSGGVDSSVAATLLLEQGYRVDGVFMKNWEESDDSGHCPAERDFRDARSVCDTLGISLRMVSFSRHYRERVFEHFLRELRAGHTPNPDILCNREIKFRSFLEYALEQGAECIATGHYARIERRGGRLRLLRARDGSKDQTYFLYSLDQEQLARSMFPLGELEKSQVRAIAARQGLVTHDKRDSTGICFIGKRNFRNFLARHLAGRPGEMRTPEGELLGEHDGLMFYTLGQRQGLGIGGRAGRSSGEPWYVVGKDPARNILYVSQGIHPMLFSTTLEAGSLHWISGEPVPVPLRCSARVRHRQPLQECVITHAGDGRCHVRFDRAQQAVTPGQSIVFYAGEECLGGAVIERTDAPAAERFRRGGA